MVPGRKGESRALRRSELGNNVCQKNGVKKGTLTQDSVERNAPGVERPQKLGLSCLSPRSHSCLISRNAIETW